MTVDTAKYIRKLVSLPHDVVRAIKVYRHQHEIDTESETIRLLIGRGLEPANAAVPQASRPSQAPAPRADVPRATEPGPARPRALPGPYLWLGMDDTETEKLNTDIPKRVRVQLDWLRRQEEATGRKRPRIGKVVSDALREYAARELRARGAPE